MSGQLLLEVLLGDITCAQWWLLFYMCGAQRALGHGRLHIGIERRPAGSGTSGSARSGRVAAEGRGRGLPAQGGRRGAETGYTGAALDGIGFEIGRRGRPAQVSGTSGRV